MNKLWYKKRSSLHGSGLFAATNIKNKEQGIQYIGDKVTKKEGDNNYKLVWGHSLSIPFQPDKLRISIDTGRLYHPFPVKNAKKFGQSTMFGLLKSHLTISISNRIGSYGNNNFNNNGNDDDWYFEWGDKKHKIEVV